MWLYIGLALLVEIVIILINALRYKIMLSATGTPVSVKNTFLINLGVKFSTFITPFKMGAIVTKPIATSSLANVPVKKSMPIIAFEQFFDIGWQILALPFMLVLIGEAALISNFIIEFIIIALMFVFVGIAYTKRSYLFSKLWSIKRFLPSKFQRFGKKMVVSKKNLKESLRETAGHVSNRIFLFKVSLMTLITIFVAPAVIYFCGLAFSVPMSYPTAILIYWASMIIGRFSGIPGGFGAREFSLIAMLTAFGFPIALSASFSVLYRGIKMIAPIAIGGPVFFYTSGRVTKDVVFENKENNNQQKEKKD
jgi:uncharacterized protein (TIRG00374 family)